MATERPAHSLLGASGAERWMNCPGSVALLRELKLPETDDPEYRTLGTSAHDAAYTCLTKQLDGWEVVGEKHGHHEVDAGMADAIQIYLDEVRSLITPTTATYFEFGIDAPEFHSDFYGTLDCGLVDGRKMFIRDYKHGEGIAVEVEENPQIMYYAYGLLRHHPEVEEVNLGIVQPRIPYREPIQTWETTADHIREWAETKLITAMNNTAIDGDLDAGNWCRFCPAKLVCPLMTALYGAAMQADPKQIINLSNDALGKSYHYLAAVKQYIKAFEAETFRRLNAGEEVPETKLVFQKSNRVWKAGAAELFLEQFGPRAQTAPELLSPAVMEKIDPRAKKLVHEWAYTPKGGMTVAPADDRRPAIKVTSTQETFPQEMLDTVIAES